jgi:hypothetical protein
MNDILPPLWAQLAVVATLVLALTFIVLAILGVL